MNLTEHFATIFDLPVASYPQPDLNVSVGITPNWLYCTVKGVKQQYERMWQEEGLIWIWLHENAQFTFKAFVMDKKTMYFEKVSFDMFKESFIFHRPEVKKDITSMMRLDVESELETVLKQEYETDYDLYYPEIIKYLKASQL